MPDSIRGGYFASAFARVVNWTAFIVSVSGVDVGVDHLSCRASGR
jgi:hypothetical protein